MLLNRGKNSAWRRTASLRARKSDRLLAPEPREQLRPFSGPTGALQRLGLAARALASCVGLYVDILLGRERLDLPALAHWLRVGGLSMLGSISLLSGALGMILAIQVEHALATLNLPSLMLGALTVGVVHHLVPVLVGVLVAGRVGVAMAARQAAMLGSGELDGLLINGIDPIRFTLGPALLAMLAMSFALSVWGIGITLASAFLWLQASSAISPALFVDVLTDTIAPRDLVAAFGKPMLFALLIGLIATVNGSSVGRDVSGIGEAATRTMIGAVTAILLVNLAFVLLWPI